MSAYFRQIDHLYHMTLISNLSSILNDGLFSHDEINRRGVHREDISLASVQERRHQRIEPIHNRSIHEYVCLYFSPRNPMLFKRRELQNNIVILGLSRNLIKEKDTIFTDGNAASEDTKFYHGIEELDYLPWGIIESEYWTDYEDGKRIKCAETLVYKQIDKSAIHRVYCRTPDQYHRVVPILGVARSIACVRPKLFF